MQHARTMWLQAGSQRHLAKIWLRQPTWNQQPVCFTHALEQLTTQSTAVYTGCGKGMPVRSYLDAAWQGDVELGGAEDVEQGWP